MSANTYEFHEQVDEKDPPKMKKLYITYKKSYTLKSKRLLQFEIFAFIP